MQQSVGSAVGRVRREIGTKDARAPPGPGLSGSIGDRRDEWMASEVVTRPFAEPRGSGFPTDGPRHPVSDRPWVALL
jgi:hypothetical protein